MDIEFHYNITYLIAARAGLGTSDARTLAYASQYVDDNVKRYEVKVGRTLDYSNYISQTANILKPKKELYRIYAFFHFIPGAPLAVSAMHRDGKMHLLNTTPDSPNANLCIDEAFKSNNLYQMGIASHGYVDTWAHQNFVGYFDAFNAMKGLFSKLIPNVGHADAMHKPDLPALVWKDGRLLDSCQVIDNKKRFLEASGRLFEKLRIYCDGSCSKRALNADKAKLIKDIDLAIGKEDKRNSRVKTRVKNYNELSATVPYGASPMWDYDKREWFDDAVRTTTSRRRNKRRTFTYAWKDVDYRDSDWFKFQEAVKVHQDMVWDLLKGPVFLKMDLRKL